MEGGSVVRYHTRPGIRPDTDAHHSHGVSMLCEILSGGQRPDGSPSASATLLMAANTHDLAEQMPGDVSAPAKRSVFGLADLLQGIEHRVLTKYNLNYEQHLTANETTILKMADCFDGMMYCCRELALGNKNAMLIWRRYCTYALSITTNEDLPIEIGLRASTVFEAIKEIYQEVTSVHGPDFDVFASE